MRTLVALLYRYSTLARRLQAFRPLGWLKFQKLSASLGVEGAFDHADVEGGVFEDGRPVPVASKPLQRSAFVSAQGGPFGHTAGKGAHGR